MPRNSEDKIKTQKRTFYVVGMHCASCELLIEKTLLKMKGVESVEASTNDNRVDVYYSDEADIDVNKLNKEFKSLGYRFQNKKIKKSRTPILAIKNGNLVFDRSRVKDLLKTLLALVIFAVTFVLFDRLQLGRFISVDESSSLPAFFLLGLVAGLSSCAALVGGLLLSMTKKWNDVYIDKSENKKYQPHMMFHIGRIISFALLGGLLGLLGGVVSLNNTVVFSILTIVVSVVMLLLALQMLEVKWAQKIVVRAPKFMTRYVADSDNLEGRYMPLGIGALTFFLPCGFTLIAQTIALTSGSFFTGAMIMLFFSLGTLIPLGIISFSGVKLNSKPHLTAKFNLIAGLVIVFFALYNINGQMNVLGYPSLSDIDIAKNEELRIKNAGSDEGSIVKQNEEGEQILEITAQGFSYIPTSSTTLKAGVPTVMEVNNKGIQGCGAYMAARGLFPNYVALRPGMNYVEFVPRKGTYKLTCTMGMVPPVTIEVI